MAEATGTAEPTKISSRRHDPAETRRLLLETGRLMVFENGMPESIDIRVADVVAAAGRTTGSAYQIWASQAEYQHDLAIYIAETFDWVEPMDASEIDAIVDAGLSFHNLIQTACEMYFAAFMSHQRFYLSLRFWSVLDPSPKLCRAIQDGYESVTAGFGPLFGHALSVYGRKIREPFEMRDLTIAMTAVVEGMALRMRFDADAVLVAGATSESVFSNSMIAIVEHFTEEADAPE